MLNIHCINTHYENYLFFIYDVSWNCVCRIHWFTNCIWKKISCCRWTNNDYIWYYKQSRHSIKFCIFYSGNKWWCCCFTVLVNWIIVSTTVFFTCLILVTYWIRLYVIQIFVWARIDNPEALSPPLSIVVNVHERQL
jgi:hypothetical protein